MDSTNDTSRILYVSDRHAILSAFRDAIEAAEHSILLQMYLFARNGEQTLLLPRPGSFPYANTVARWLIEKKKLRPKLPIVVVLDSNTPENPKRTRSGGTLLRQFLLQHGIVVLCANLFATKFDRRRHFLSAKNLHLNHENIPAAEWVETQNLWQALHNVEDHRKNLLIDQGRLALVTSHNLFDPAWDWYENLFWIEGGAAKAVFSSALLAVRQALEIPQPAQPERPETWLPMLCKEPLPELPETPANPSDRMIDGYPFPRSNLRSQKATTSQVLVLEHAAIRERLSQLLQGAQKEDRLLIATAYFSDLSVMEEVESALKRGVHIHVLIDSLHALPLPPVFRFLTTKLVNFEVVDRALRLQTRYPETFAFRIHHSVRGAMMHLKTAARLGREPLLLGGQANYTPNSFGGAYLETDLETQNTEVVGAFAKHFETLWLLPDTRPLKTKPGVSSFFMWILCKTLLLIFRVFGIRP